jgi:restriction system protein
VASNLKIPESRLLEQTSSGALRFVTRINFARLYLRHAGLLESSDRGVWRLTDKGLRKHLGQDEAMAVFKEVQSKFPRKAKPDRAKEKTDPGAGDEPEVEEAAEETSHREQVMHLLQSLPAAGFERLCLALLREAGFQQLKVTGRSGDGGIDGQGVLFVGPLVSFRVVFQCKRYQGSVSPKHVREFQGAMQGRADKGLILTTGTFTRQAREESSRHGALPVELVDGEKLMEMFEALKFGVEERRVFVVKRTFFDVFMKSDGTD